MICLFILTSFSQGGVSVNCHGLRESRDRVVIRNPSSNKQICFDVTWHSQIRAKYNTRRNAKEQPGSAMAEGKRDDLHLTSTGRGHAFRNSLQFPPLDFKVVSRYFLCSGHRKKEHLTHHKLKPQEETTLIFFSWHFNLI